MCGIFGIKSSLSIDDKIKLVRNNCNILSHRGPDHSDIWVDNVSGSVFGHTRLAIIDLQETGNQPMVSECKRYVIVFNGEIYNYKDLKNIINNSKKGIIWKGSSDTEVLLKCFELFGIQKTLNLIDGMFAFVIWDQRNKEMYMARDRIGEKPLYYTINSETIVFSSELKSFKNISGLELTVSEASMVKYFKYGYIKSPNTIFKNIFQLQPGYYIKIETKKNNFFQNIKYWDIESNNTSEIDTKIVKNILLKKIDHSVKTRMYADVPMGSFLSGGYDSSIITYFMQKNSMNKINTFTIGQNNQQDESKHAREISKFIGTNHHEYFIEEIDMLQTIQNISKLIDQPFGDSSIIPTYLVSQFAKKKVKVALSGDGGDEIFGGYTRYKYVNLFNNLSALSPDLLKTITDKLTPKSMVKTKRFLELIKSNNQFEINEKMRIAWSNIKDLLNFKDINEIDYNKNYFNFDLLYEDLKSYLPDDILTKVDRASMLNSLEVRSPLLDHNLVEYMFKIPNKYKYNSFSNKILFKDLAHECIPKNLLDRKKEGFSIPISSLIRTDLKDWAHETLSISNLSKHSLFNNKYITNLLNDHIYKNQNNSYKIWYILMFQSWFLNFRNE